MLSICNMQLVLGLPLYLKFAGAIIIALKRWLSADDIDEDNEVEMDKYFVTIHTAPLRMPAIGDRTLVLRDDDPIIPADKEKTSVGGSTSELYFAVGTGSCCTCIYMYIGTYILIQCTCVHLYIRMYVSMTGSHLQLWTGLLLYMFLPSPRTTPPPHTLSSS